MLFFVILRPRKAVSANTSALLFFGFYLVANVNSELTNGI